MASADLAAQPVLLRVLVRLIVLLTVLGEPVMALHWRPLPQGGRGVVIAAELLRQTCLRFGSVVLIRVRIRGLFGSRHTVLTVSVSGDPRDRPVARRGPCVRNTSRPLPVLRHDACRTGARRAAGYVFTVATGDGL